MIVRMMLAAAALAATVGVSQADEAHAKHHHKKGEPVAEKAVAPQDEPPLPEKVQKWFGNTVDDILTGADKTLGGDAKK